MILSVMGVDAVPNLQQVVNDGNNIVVDATADKGINIVVPDLRPAYTIGACVTVDNQTGGGGPNSDAFVAKINGQTPGSLTNFVGGFSAVATGADNWSFVSEHLAGASSSIHFRGNNYTGATSEFVKFTTNTLDVVNIDHLGNITANKFIKTGGTNTQYLMADGSTSSGGGGGGSGTVSGTTNYVAKFTGSTAVGDSSIFDNGIGVGIGLTSIGTTYRLSVNGGGFFNDTVFVANGGSMKFSLNTIFIKPEFVSGGYKDLAFYTNTTESMRILENSNVLIGATLDNAISNAKLQVAGRITTSEEVFLKPTYTTSFVSALSYSGNGINAWGELALRSWSTGNGFLANIKPNNPLTDNRSYTLPDATGTIALTSDLEAYVTLTGPNQTITGRKDFNNSVVGTNLVFSVTGTGTGIYMTNTGAGHGIKVWNQSTGPSIDTLTTGLGSGIQAVTDGIGTALSVNMNSTGKGLQIHSTLSATGMPLTVQKNSVDKFTVSDNGTVTAATGFFVSSDVNLKDIIEKNGDTIKFTWKDKRDEKVHIGYIAQEVQEKYPDQVNENSDGMLTVNYIEVLVAKLQELENRIKQLEK